MIRLGVDFGGTKIEVAALDETGAFGPADGRPNPGDYEAPSKSCTSLREVGGRRDRARGAPVGVGMPGSASPLTGKTRNANSTWLNGEALVADLEAAIGRPVRTANDANCFALSEATRRRRTAAQVVFGVILGTGCGGGVVVGGALIGGANGVAGEWGHTPLPWPTAAELRPPSAGAGGRAAWRRGSQAPDLPGTTKARPGNVWRQKRSWPRARAGEAAAAHGFRTLCRSSGSRIGGGLRHRSTRT